MEKTSFTIAGEFSRESSIALADFLNCPEGEDKENFLFNALMKAIIDFLGQQLVSTGIPKEQVDAILSEVISVKSYGVTNYENN